MRALPGRPVPAPSKGVRPRPLDILLIEDTPADADRTVRALRIGGVRCRVRIAENGDEALQVLRRKRPARQPDLILLDWYLPKKDGREVLEEIKGDPKLRPIPIVILSVSDHECDISAAYDRHANSFVTKPADLDHFARAMKFIEIFWKGKRSGRRAAKAPAAPSSPERSQRKRHREAETHTSQPRPAARRKKSG
jgi:chemotaxis family two-component system response regulator Rcp1